MYLLPSFCFFVCLFFFCLWIKYVAPILIASCLVQFYWSSCGGNMLPELRLFLLCGISSLLGSGNRCSTSVPPQQETPLLWLLFGFSGFQVYWTALCGLPCIACFLGGERLSSCLWRGKKIQRSSGIAWGASFYVSFKASSEHSEALY